MFVYKMNVENNIVYFLIFVMNDIKRYILIVLILIKIIYLFEMSSLYEKKNILFILFLFILYKKLKRIVFVYFISVFIFVLFLKCL